MGDGSKNPLSRRKRQNNAVPRWQTYEILLTQSQRLRVALVVPDVVVQLVALYDGQYVQKLIAAGG